MSTLQLRDVRVTFTTAVGGIPALKDVSLHLREGDFATVIGANGAGKSTLVNVIAGAQPTSGGRVELDGEDLAGVPEHRRARMIARVFQDTNASICGELTIEENLMLAATRPHRRSPVRFAVRRHRVRDAAEALDAYGTGLSSRLKQPAGLLSGGQRQLVALAMAVLARPRVLLLDEHTSALDPKMAETVMEATEQLVRDSGLTTLMITHHLGFASRYGNRLLIMNAGRIVDELDPDSPERRDQRLLIERFRTMVAGAVSDRMLA